jgi:hypothetical protein
VLHAIADQALLNASGVLGGDIDECAGVLASVTSKVLSTGSANGHVNEDERLEAAGLAEQADDTDLRDKTFE